MIEFHEMSRAWNHGVGGTDPIPTQTGILPLELLEMCLNDEGHHQSKYTPGLWTKRMETNLFHPCGELFVSDI